jgi:hypothetical protein
LSKIKDEQFSAEVEKRLQTLFSDSDDKQLSYPLNEGGDSKISSEEDIIDEISEEELFFEETNEEDPLEEISEEDLLTENDFSENVLDDDLDENVLDDDFAEDFLDDELKEDLLENDSDIPGNTEPEDFSIKEEGEFHFYPFRLLKSIILSIDWEITDDIMDRFVSQVTGLMETYKDDKFVLIFLHLLWELGKYIKKHLGQSHPNSIKTLNSIYNALEKLLSSKDLSDPDKKKILSVEMIKFKTLKEQISLQHVDPSEKLLPKQIQANAIEKTELKMSKEIISSEMREVIKTVVRDELKALIKEFSDWAIKR